MPFQARHVMSRASTTLNDVGAVRWTAPELRNYLNDAIREIAVLKPNSMVARIDHPLVAGTEQTLPSNATLLVRVDKNTVSKKAVTLLANREIMDRTIPGWQNSTVLPYAADAVHIIYDVANPKAFQVVPGNTGTGRIEIIVSKLPDSVATPETNTNLEITSYTENVDLDSIFINACVDYVIHAALRKDSALAGAATRSVAHYTQFVNAITAMRQNDGFMSAGAQASQGGGAAAAG